MTTMIIPTIQCGDLAFTGFGDREAATAVGYVWNRNTHTDHEPLAFFIQHSDRLPHVGVYFGLMDDEADSTDYNLFRQYAIHQAADDTKYDPTLWAFHMLEIVRAALTVRMTAAQIDRALVIGQKAVRII